MANGEYNHRLSDFIVVIRGLVPQEKCREIINLYKDHDAMNWALTIGGLDLDQRKVKQMRVSDDKITSSDKKFADTDKELFEFFSKAQSIYTKTLTEQRNMSDVLSISSDEGYQFLRYSEGYYFKEHTDNGIGMTRILTCTLNLNSDYDGGVFRLLRGEFDVTLGEGDAILFPSNFMFPHEVTEITRGERYSIVTWFH